jgi:NDP-sugar pyrophosphorylase family protein
MKALILAAGIGTRLKPLTDRIPKALIEIGGYSMLEVVIRQLSRAGIRSIVINTHHFPEQIREFIRINESFGLDICFSDESDQLLDTGGAIKKAAGFFENEAYFLVHNVDILTNLKYQEIISDHQKSGSLATLAVMSRPTTRNLLIDRNGTLCGWEYAERHVRITTRESMKGLNYTAFSGVYVLSQPILKMFPSETVFGFMPWILELASTGKIQTWDHSGSLWYEVGRPESVERAVRELTVNPDKPEFITRK